MIAGMALDGRANEVAVRRTYGAGRIVVTDQELRVVGEGGAERVLPLKQMRVVALRRRLEFRHPYVGAIVALLLLGLAMGYGVFLVAYSSCGSLRAARYGGLAALFCAFCGVYLARSLVRSRHVHVLHIACAGRKHDLELTGVSDREAEDLADRLGVGREQSD
jgi:hypothetical protein